MGSTICLCLGCTRGRDMRNGIWTSTGSHGFNAALLQKLLAPLAVGKTLRPCRKIQGGGFEKITVAQKSGQPRGAGRIEHLQLSLPRNPRSKVRTWPAAPRPRASNYAERLPAPLPVSQQDFSGADSNQPPKRYGMRWCSISSPCRTPWNLNI